MSASILRQFIYFFILAVFFRPVHGKSIENLRKNIVQIKVFSSEADPYSPWNKGSFSSGSGTGFVISDNYILTNAHVVSNARYIQGQRHNQTVWYELKVEYIAHDCDLAVLKAVETGFYDGITEPLKFGGIPELNTPVTVIGYPLGGKKISVSRGIVSRKELSTYAHSAIDSHLVIQVDAAINPGNSGGPVFQDDRVIGVAFQVATKGENIGYVIPVTVINRFMGDIKDGRYDGYVELGIHTLNSFNRSLRAYRKIPDNLDGVFVTKVIAGSSADGHLRPWDLLLTIDGMPIGRNGTVQLDRDARVEFIEAIENKYAGEIINFRLLRDGKPREISFPAKIMKDFHFMRNWYEEKYDYIMFGGLVFQPVSRNLLARWSRQGSTAGGSQLIYRFFYFLEDDWNREVENDIVFYRKLSHKVNSHADFYQNMILEEVNGKKIRNLDELRQVIARSKDKFLLFRFRDTELPLVIKREDALRADVEIRKSYGIDK